MWFQKDVNMFPTDRPHCGSCMPVSVCTYWACPICDSAAYTSNRVHTRQSFTVGKSQTLNVYFQSPTPQLSSRRPLSLVFLEKFHRIRGTFSNTDRCASIAIHHTVSQARRVICSQIWPIKSQALLLGYLSDVARHIPGYWNLIKSIFTSISCQRTMTDRPGMLLITKPLQASNRNNPFFFLAKVQEPHYFCSIAF